MPVFEAILFAILQGVSELFPISSLGHGVVVPDLFHWQIDRNNEKFLPFMVMLHFGTSAALLIYFRRDWFALFGAFFKARGRPISPDSKLLWQLCVGTIPAGLIGLLLEKKLRLLFVDTKLVLVILMINGLLLMMGDHLKERGGGRTLSSLSYMDSLKIGLAQSLALLPGISRSGGTLIAGLASGLDYPAAARFSFLLGTPIILAASLLEIPKLTALSNYMPFELIATCGAVSGVFTYLSIWVLMRYFNRHEVEALRPFGWYCIVAGGLGLIWKII